MAEFVGSKPTVAMEITMRLNLAEARALDALAGYDVDSFLEFFYEKMGQAYLKPNEKGLRTLFRAIVKDVTPLLRRADDANRAINGVPHV